MWMKYDIVIKLRMALASCLGKKWGGEQAEMGMGHKTCG